MVRHRRGLVLDIEKPVRIVTTRDMKIDSNISPKGLSYPPIDEDVENVFTVIVADRTKISSERDFPNFVDDIVWEDEGAGVEILMVIPSQVGEGFRNIGGVDRTFNKISQTGGRVDPIKVPDVNGIAIAGNCLKGKLLL